MTLDITSFIDSKGGNAEEIRASQRKRGHPVEVVDEVVAMYAEWVKMDFDTNALRKKVNEVQKQIAAKKKAKEPADALVAEKKALDADVETKKREAKEFEARMRAKAGTVGNIVGSGVPVSLTEDDNVTVRTWFPQGEAEEPVPRAGILPHHEVLLRLDAMDLDRGAKIAGHRGYFLTNDGIDLNQALIAYGLDYLRGKGYKKIQPPFFMNKDQMAKTAQLDQFDEELYKVVGSDDEKYLIATSEQPISAYHSDEWFESPETQLPIKYAGYSTCFRKEAGSAGRDMWGIFRVHQFEKVEQFVITDPKSSWEMFETMIGNSEGFYQSLGLRYRVVGIVSGALNLAAAQKYDLEAWFPFQGAYKELVSVSNCTDYQARKLEVRCGIKNKEQTRKVRDAPQWQPPAEHSTLVFRRDQLQRIWQWEVASGHYPSSPARPAPPRRTYPDIQSVYPSVAYPPRPVPGSVADMDIIMAHCDFSADKVRPRLSHVPPLTAPQYVRDCLEVLRVGAGLDNGRRTRRGNTDDWRYIYIESNATAHEPESPAPDLPANPNAEPEPQLVLPAPRRPRPASPASPCDPENPRLFHMFWTGPFTDKPYLALLSFLYTQNTGIHLAHWPPDARVCRPQFWLWINPGPAASVPNPSAYQDMLAQLRTSPWAAPFLDPRFSDVIHFKLWNTTEQLDGVPEIKDEWRGFKTLFNSGGHVISVPSDPDADANHDNDDMLKRTGSKSSSSYDRLSVILSDMARFILCHRFGGIYLDADTIFLRDWEELWGWQGAFAYRWSRLEKYNTAVLRMHRHSALGAFLFRTALRNGLDFHPMSVSLYMAEAGLEPLLLRLPDALFDSAWLNTENYQRDRPPQPFFTEFADFFDTPAQNSAAPQALGFDGFFKGAYSYHFHNFWCVPGVFPPSFAFADGDDTGGNRSTPRGTGRTSGRASRAAGLG
ncbi:hypothetical protein C0993_007474, partial [Termitomyces sp. T159_Od127]